MSCFFVFPCRWCIRRV